MRKVLLLGAIALGAAGPMSAQAKTWQAKTWRISCATVRAYVAEVGVVQARAVALAHGMTAWQERLARRCLSEAAQAER